jgi:hypothetical protein
MGYASARGKTIIALRTDFRKVGSEEKVNFMLEESATVVTSQNDLITMLNIGLRITKGNYQQSAPKMI